MQEIRTNIIPVHQTFAKVDASREWNKEAICVFVALGFFLDQDTFYNDTVALPPGSIITLDNRNRLVQSEPWFSWHYTPRSISFSTALEEFTSLFETIISEQVANNKVVLPISGGLDSRTQAVALKHLGKEVAAYSYEFQGGYNETKIATSIAALCEFPFQKFTIPPGYLWSELRRLSNINKCYSEFTHPRQMAVVDHLAKMGEIFSLGHWGDVLFDKHASEIKSEADTVHSIIKKVVKKGGKELATALWKTWELEGDFDHYLYHRIAQLCQKIDIDHPSAKMRAFKSTYWAPRWTSINLSIFESALPVTLPYYDDRMCKFICSIPEEYLADRKLQIAYIKKRNPAVAKVMWQDHKPYNLYNYSKNKSPNNLPYRIVQKAKRELQGMMGTRFIQRNWELQFLGKENDRLLQEYLNSTAITAQISKELINQFYTNFKEKDAVYYSHPVSMLLTLALKYQQEKRD